MKTRKYFGIVDRTGFLYVSTLCDDKVKSWQLFIANLGFLTRKAALALGYECREITISY